MPKGIFQRTERTKRRISESKLKRKIKLGYINSPETRKKISKAHKGMKKPWAGKYRHTKEHNRKISEALKGRKLTDEHKRKLGKTLKGKPLSEETKRKLSEAMKGRKPWNKGKKTPEEAKRKMRISRFEYIKKITNILFPAIGHNEKQILDKLENEINHKIIRQYKCQGYFIDGYIPELKIAIEVDEMPKNREKDIEREKIIKNELGCEFLRVKDYD